MARIVIADAGSLIALAGIKCLSILRQLFFSVTYRYPIGERGMSGQARDRYSKDRAFHPGGLVNPVH